MWRYLSWLTFAPDTYKPGSVEFVVSIPFPYNEDIHYTPTPLLFESTIQLLQYIARCIGSPPRLATLPICERKLE